MIDITLNNPPMTQILPITVVIPVRDEEQGLKACLDRLSRFERIVVIDSGSKDATCDIAKKNGVEVIHFEWNGNFPKKRNWFLRNHTPTTPWVLFLDADEILDEKFCDELSQVLPHTTHAGFWLTYDNWFMGRRLQYGMPNRKLALFKVGTGEYERVDEHRWTNLDMEIHEHPILSGTVGNIKSHIEHRDDRGLSHWLNRHNEYAMWEARQALNIKVMGMDRMTTRQRLKYKTLGKWWLPSLYFLDSYIRRLGFFDGFQGFMHAKLKAEYFKKIGSLLKEYKSQQKLLNREPSPYTIKQKVMRVLWSLVQATAFGWSFHNWYAWRRWLLRLFGATISNTAKIRRSVVCECPWNLSVGEDTVIGDEVILYCLGTVTIGNRVTLSQYSHICAGSHDYTTSRFTLIREPIVIHDWAWIAADAFVGPRVTVGEGAILSARGVTLRNLNPWTIYLGNPAQPIRIRPQMNEKNSEK